MSTLDSHLLFLQVRHALRYTRTHEHTPHVRAVRRLKRMYDRKHPRPTPLKDWMRRAARSGDETAKAWLRNKGLG